MSTLKQKFTVHPVGQGLFYSGTISYCNNSRESTFRFVFDCGSLNYPNCAEEVALYRKETLSADVPLDLLIISHFDADHFNFLKALLNGRTVKKVIAPFIGYKERVAIALNYLESIEGISDTDHDPDFVINFVIDPVRTLSEIIKGGFEMIFIDRHTDRTFDLESDATNVNGDDDGDVQLVFDFDGELENFEPQDDIINLPSGVTVKKTHDSNKGLIKLAGRYSVITDLLFYRISLGSKESDFFKEVYSEFLETFAKELNNNTNPTVSEIVTVLKTITSSGQIVPLFKSAFGKMPGIINPRRGIANLNSTALAVLQVNRRSFYKKPNKRNVIFDFVPCSIIKLNGKNDTQIEKCLDWPSWPFYRRYWHLNLEVDAERADKLLNGSLPNVLLTSDSYLLTEAEVDTFYNRYKNYWNRFWLFQIPHHGSEYNCDLIMLNKLPSKSLHFINYGAVKTWPMNWRFPSPAFMSTLNASTISHKTLPVNEYNGVKFYFNLKWIS